MKRRFVDRAIVSAAIIIAGILVYGYAVYLVVRGPDKPRNSSPSWGEIN